MGDFFLFFILSLLLLFHSNSFAFTTTTTKNFVFYFFTISTPLPRPSNSRHWNTNHRPLLRLWPFLWESGADDWLATKHSPQVAHCRHDHCPRPCRHSGNFVSGGEWTCRCWSTTAHLRKLQLPRLGKQGRHCHCTSLHQLHSTVHASAGVCHSMRMYLFNERKVLWS